MIATVTLNPSLDRTLRVPRLVPGALHRACFVRQDLGGKGINVARALRALGIPSRILGFAAGNTGRALRDGLVAVGLDVCFVQVEGETRQNVTLFDDTAAVHTKINEAGPAIAPEHVDALERHIEQMGGPGDLWAFCGSLPPGAPSNIYARLIGAAQRGGGRALLDASGAALREGLAAHPFGAKPNTEEASDLLGTPLHNDEDHCVAARRMQAEGTALVAISRGADGLVLAAQGELLIARPSTVPVRCPIGAGDALVAGLLWAVSEQCDPIETARRAVACGTAAAMQEGTEVGGRALVAELLGKIEVTVHAG